MVTFLTETLQEKLFLMIIKPLKSLTIVHFSEDKFFDPLNTLCLRLRLSLHQWFYLKLFYFFLQSGDCPLRLISRAPVAEQLYQWYLEATPRCQKMVLDVGRGAYGWLAAGQQSNS